MNIDVDLEPPPRIGLIGSITSDVITRAAGAPIRGVGGLLYQAAALCGLGRRVALYTHVAAGARSRVEAAVRGWKTLCTDTWVEVPGSGNQVRLHYPLRGERREVLVSVVPPLDPAIVTAAAANLDFLILVMNSGFDITLPAWRRVVDASSCPIWFDIHSLALSRNLGSPRTYRSIPDWIRWVEGVEYVQANLVETSALLGSPAQSVTAEDQEKAARAAFGAGVKALFITQGRHGVRIMTPGTMRRAAPSVSGPVADTTGCGDVFCAGTVDRLLAGDDPFSAADSAVRLASRAAGVVGVEETFRLVRGLSRRAIS